MRKMMDSLKTRVELLYVKTGRILMNKDGSGYVDQAVVILTGIVIGALLLAGLYALFGDVVLPTLTKRIQEMFDYKG